MSIYMDESVSVETFFALNRGAFGEFDSQASRVLGRDRTFGHIALFSCEEQ
jgi:hypothetical protein